MNKASFQRENSKSPEYLQYVALVATHIEQFVAAVSTEISSNIIQSAASFYNIIQPNVTLQASTFIGDGFQDAVIKLLNWTNPGNLVALITLLSRIFYVTPNLFKELKFNICELLMKAFNYIPVERNSIVFATLMCIASEYDRNDDEMEIFAGFIPLLMQSAASRPLTLFDLYYCFNVHPGIKMHKDEEKMIFKDFMVFLMQIAFNPEIDIELSRIAIKTIAQNTQARYLGSTILLLKNGLVKQFVEMIPNIIDDVILDGVFYILAACVGNEANQSESERAKLEEHSADLIPIEFIAQNIENFSENCQGSVLNLLAQLAKTKSKEIIEANLIPYAINMYQNPPSYQVGYTAAYMLCELIIYSKQPHIIIPDLENVLRAIIERISDGSDEKIAYFVFKMIFDLKSKMTLEGKAEDYEQIADVTGVAELFESYQDSQNPQLQEAMESYDFDADLYQLKQNLEIFKQQRDAIALEHGYPTKYCRR